MRKSIGDPKVKGLAKFSKAIPWILLISGVVGLICSAVLTYDHNKIAQNPNYIPNCNLNPVIACGSVIRSKQAEAFKFPNPYVGLVAFPALMVTGVGMLAGGRFKKWYWWGMEAGSLFGLGFVHWLFFETVYRIHALCPYCMVVWVVTITTFWYTTLYNLNNGYLPTPKFLKGTVAFATRHHLDILIVWFLIIAGLILKHFWYYYGHYF